MTTLKKHQEKLGKLGGAATLKKRGVQHYRDMRAIAGAKMYFRGMLDGLTVGKGITGFTSTQYEKILIECLRDKKYKQLLDHRILGKFYN